MGFPGLFFGLFSLLGPEAGDNFFDLENGLAVFSEPSTSASSIEIRAFFRCGPILEAESQRGLTTFLAHALERSFSAKKLEVKSAIREELCSFSLTLSPERLQPSLEILRQVFWTEQLSEESILGFEVELEQEKKLEGKLSRELKPSDFFPYFLEQSPYRLSGEFGSNRKTSWPVNAVRDFRRDFFHPHNGFLWVKSGLKGEELRETLEKTLGQYRPKFFSSSFSILEETPHLSGKGRVLFRPVDTVQMAIVFAAPPRGSQAWIPFCYIRRFFEETFSVSRVHAWSGLGTGFFWVDYETSVERFEEVFPRFQGEVEICRLEGTGASLWKRAPLMDFGSSAEKREPEALAFDHFWGAGPAEAWIAERDLSRVTEQEIRSAARSFFSRSYFFVVWPESKKEQWPGFPPR